MSNQSRRASGSSSGDDRAHLDGVETGAGCTEIWEKLSEHREEAAGQAASDD